MKMPLHCLLIAILAHNTHFAWRAMRRGVLVARRKLDEAQLIPGEFGTVTREELEDDPFFGDPHYLAAIGQAWFSPFGQFWRRWLILFPLTWAFTLINPFTWIYSLPTALVLWLIDLRL